jgi:hypothetical protein
LLLLMLLLHKFHASWLSGKRKNNLLSSRLIS